jgi:signal transduction histidine kinase/ActR/RegA family two-component response regulator
VAAGSPDEARLLAKLRLLNQVAQAAAGSLDLSHLLTVALRELDWYFPLHACVVWLLVEDEKAKPADDEVTASAPPMPAKWPGENVSNSSPPITQTVLDQAALPQAGPCIEIVKTSSPRSDRSTRLGLTQGRRLALDQTPFQTCLLEGEALYADLGRPDERRTSLAEELAQHGGTSFFAVPLRSGDRAVGVLQSVCTRAEGFVNEQIQMLYLVADLLGPAISNCQLFTRLKNAYEELRFTQTRLVQAEKMRALGEMAGGMAHDFNNSLCGVLGFLDLALADRGLPESVRGYLEYAKLSTLDAAQTVRRVQNFARWQRNEMSMQRLDVNELVKQTLELTRPKWESQARARGATIAAETCCDASRWIFGSAGELREVLTNLIFNAVDAMPQGGQLTLRTWNTDSDAYLSVRDTGMGMTDSVRLRLFEPFFTTKGERGTGLGLSVAFGIIQRYGGEIVVATTPGTGSEFVVRLPLATRGLKRALNLSPRAALEVRPPTESAAGAPASTPRMGKGRSLRILVIEDQESIRRFLDTGLRQMGHRPSLAADANEGLTAFGKEAFDLILTDLGLPDLSGKEVAARVCKQSPQTPVILLTGWSEQLRDQNQLLQGVTRVLGKPITLQVLRDAIEVVCSAGEKPQNGDARQGG